uniref:TOG domain-containing protein n=1 Tax=Strigamia maritima TaxID=126957 RepID=T1IXN3_STRMM
MAAVTFDNPTADDMSSSSSSKCSGGNKTNRRSELLAYLRSTVRENGDFIHFPNKLTLFKELHHILGDDAWQVRHECIQLIGQLICMCGADLDECVDLVLVRLVRNLGHEKILVRRTTVHTLHAYVKHSGELQRVIDAIVVHGLQNGAEGVGETSQEYTMFCLPMLLTPEFDGQNFFVLVQTLARILAATTAERREAALIALQKVRQLVGKARFDQYLDKLHPRILEEIPEEFERLEDLGSVRRDSSSDEGDVEDEGEDDDDEASFVGQNGVYEFGILPTAVISKLNDLEDWEIRCRGVDNLRQIVGALNDVSLVMPHLPNFIALLNRLVSDTNFKIATLALEIYRSFIDKVKYRIRPHLSPVLNALSRYLADSKLTIRCGCIRALMQLMQSVSPMPIVTMVLGNLQHKSSRMREETINLITAALLTFPSYEFDMAALCGAVAPMILDPKRKIRQCVLECMATLAQALGPMRSALLVEIVENLQREHRGLPIVAALHSRLARKLLPKVNQDGLLEYSVNVPVGTRKLVVFNARGADLEWILAGAGSMASSRTESTDGDASSGASKTEFVDSSPMVRRIVSPGRGKTRLPWDDVKERPMRGRTLSDDNVYVKGKAIPTSETHKVGRSAISANNYPRRMEMETSLNQIHYEPQGSLQKQMYLQKLRQRSSDKYGVEKAYNNMAILPDKPKVLGTNSEDEYRNNNRHSSLRNLPLGDVNSLSSMWPLQGTTPTPTSPLARKRRKILDPIHGHQGNVSNDGEAPVPTKATIIRTSSAHKHRKVPPISRASDAKENGERMSSSASSRSSSQNTVDITWNHRTETPLNEIQVATNASNKRYSYGNEVPFKSKPVLVRTPSLNKLRSTSAGSSTNDNNSSFGDELNENSKRSDQFTTPNEADEDQTLSQTRDRILFKKQQMYREAERKRVDLQRTINTDKNNHQLIEELVLPTDEEVEEIVTMPKKSAASTKTKSSPSSRKFSVSSSQKQPVTFAFERSSLSDPEAGLRDAINNLNSSQWNVKCEGAQLISRLAIHHHEVLMADLHTLTMIVLREVRNLRSSVSRAAILTFADLFTGLKRNMETQDLDNVCKGLLHKSGESNKFIQEDVEKALMCMVEWINPQRAATAIIQGGASHKNASVRKLTSQLLAEVALKLGPVKLLGAKDLTDKILPTVAHFATDSSPFTRYYGRLLFHMLIFQPQFEVVLQRTVQPNVIRNIRNVLESVKAKGAGDKPMVRN